MAGYTKRHSDWKALPDLTTPIRESDLDAWEQAIYELKYLSFNVKDYGAAGDGIADDTAAIQAAITAADAVTGGRVFVPDGTYVCGDIALKDNIRLEGSSTKTTVLKAKPGTVNAVIVGASGDTVTDAVVTKLTINGNNTGGAQCRGVQVTSGARILVSRVSFTDLYKSAVLFQTGTVDSEVSECVLANIGISESTGDHAILFQTGSNRCVARHNHITGSRQMGIALATAGNGATDCVIANNYIETVATTTGFECIGVTADCVRTLILGNQCIGSQDNGISISAANSVVSHNLIDGALNHGIAISGNDCVVVGNIAHNIGTDRPNAGTGYGGIYLNSVTNCDVVCNRLYDDQGTHTMDYGIKEFGTAGGHIYDDNRIVGALVGQYLLLANTTATLLDNRGVVAQTYSASITPDVATSEIKTITVTNGTAFTINNPTNATPGRRLILIISNGSGGTMGTITWGAKYQLAGTFANPGNGERRTITFSYDGTNWIESARTHTFGFAALDSGSKVARSNLHEGLNQFYYAGGSENIHATLDRKGISTLAGNALTSQVMMCSAIFLPAGASITNLSFRSGTALTQGSNNDGHWWFALYDTQATPALIAQTADQGTAAWAATTVKTLPLVGGPFPITVSGIYYATVMVYAGTGGAPVLPTIGGIALGSSTLSTGFAAGQKVLAGTAGAALTTTAPPTISPLNTGTLFMYAETS
jgi:hypothetical protein